MEVLSDTSPMEVNLTVSMNKLQRHMHFDLVILFLGIFHIDVYVKGYV